MRVLLLNPPARDTYLRDYFCSKSTKSNYLYPPIDLVLLSGTVSSEHEVDVFDAMAERSTAQQAHERIAKLRPEVVVSLVASVTWDQDREFLRDVAASGPRVIALGDLLQEGAGERLRENPWLEAALHDFSGDDLLHYLSGSFDRIPSMTRRAVNGSEDSIAHGQIDRGGRSYRVPRPRHELFPREGYRFSFARQERFASVLTDYGCPYPCTFCIMGQLGFRTRPTEDVLEEIDHLRASGVHEYFFLDQTFGASEERGVELCNAFADRSDMSWTAFTRPDRATDALLSSMARGGCHTVILGVESSSDAVLEATKKGYTSSIVAGAFERAKKHGLRTVGTFLIGLPEETADSLEETLEFALELELDFLSLNVAVPRFGTPFRKQVLELGLASESDLVMDQGGGEAAFLPTRTLDREEVLRLKRRAVRRFYLRPSFLWKRLRDVRSLGELRRQVREGFALLSRNVG